MKRKYWARLAPAHEQARASVGLRVTRIRIMDAWWSSSSWKVDAQRLVRKPPRSRVTCTAIFTITTSSRRNRLRRYKYARPAVQISVPSARTTEPLRLRGFCFDMVSSRERGGRTDLRRMQSGSLTGVVQEKKGWTSPPE